MGCVVDDWKILLFLSIILEQRNILFIIFFFVRWVYRWHPFVGGLIVVQPPSKGGSYIMISLYLIKKINLSFNLLLKIISRTYVYYIYDLMIRYLILFISNK